jgi:hypothetical protein
MPGFAFHSWLRAHVAASRMELVRWEDGRLCEVMSPSPSLAALTNTTTYETVTRSHRLWYLAGSEEEDNEK